ncbi:sensor histidine kinase [Chitinophaga silvatica]|uniref:Sensor histidine kinase n=2 Tax=Chitinophaga silvatica TaxID=2282649 RepID=A0A3E1YF37_9BACT|nr:sensor histidine kinase [Chitinophaga silvatica]
MPSIARIMAIYVTFLVVNFIIVPKYLEKGNWVIGVLLLVPVGLFYFVCFLIANSYYNGYLFGVYRTVRGANMHFTKSAFITTLFSGVLYVVYYYARKLFVDYCYSRIFVDPAFKKLLTEILWVAGIFVGLFCLSFSDSRDLAFLIFFFGLSQISVFFLLRYKAFPDFVDGHHKIWQLIRDLALIILICNFLVTMVSRAFFHGNGSQMGALFAIGSLVSLVLVSPIDWLLFRSQLNQEKTVFTLKKALGHSSANLDFLRSQINPHFLFNALNTLYGTALQEDASRTSEGIQKLGDMMRFMLHDNNLEKISLDKEIAYLENYIALQRLRVLSSPDIQIEVNIDDSQCAHQIAPMLLIPFVENAFKHGISLRHRSRITISMSCTHNQIFFDVYNSIHPRPENDPEKDGMGIGLNNVKERLSLLYPNKHELSIRKTATEYFVHLTINVEN